MFYQSFSGLILFKRVVGGKNSGVHKFETRFYVNPRVWTYVHHLSRYALHMVVDPKENMIKFLLGVSCFVKTECTNAMLEDMNISWHMTNAYQVEGDNPRELTKDNKKTRIGNYEYSQ